jgi:hypothetical protein
VALTRLGEVRLLEAMQAAVLLAWEDLLEGDPLPLRE